MLFWNGSLGKTPPWSPSDAESIHRKLTAYGELKRDLVGMGKFKSDTARHQDPRKQRADPSARPCGWVKQGAGGVASSVIATADGGAVGLCSGANPPGSGGTRHRCRPSCQAGGWTKTPAWEPVERGGDVGTTALHEGPLAPPRPGLDV